MKKARLNLRRNTSEYISNRRMTLMLIVVSFLYITGNLPHLVSFMFRLVYNERIVWLGRVSQCALYLLIILKSFVYFFFNSMFRICIKNFFVKLFCCFRRK
jgi:hypothetical protein